MKKLIFALLLCFLSINVSAEQSSAEYIMGEQFTKSLKEVDAKDDSNFTLTERLIKTIDSKNFSIELLRCDGKGSIKGQTGNAMIFKLSYGQKGDDYYIEYSFPEYRDRYDSIYSRYNPCITFVNSDIHKELKQGRRYYYPEGGKRYVDGEDDRRVGYHTIDSSMLRGDPEYERFDHYEEARPEDLTVVKDGIAYILQKGTETGVYAGVSELGSLMADSKSQTLIQERVNKPAFIEKLLLADPSVYEVEHKHWIYGMYQLETYIIEFYSSKRRSDGQISEFLLAYDLKGNLRLIVTEPDKIGLGIGQYLVVGLDNKVDDYNFECIPHFSLQPMNGKNRAKGAK